MNSLRGWLIAAWHSPTATTWASFALRSAGAVALLPILLRLLTPAEVTVWYLFATFASLIGLFDFGLSTTFIRAFAYAHGGQDIRNLKFSADSESVRTGPNWQSVAAVRSAAVYVYRWIAAATFLVLITAGTYFLAKPVGELVRSQIGWIAWAIVATTLPVAILNLGYFALLQGLGHVAVARRWEAVFSFCGIVSTLLILLLGGRLLALAINAQFWLLVSFLRNRLLAGYLCKPAFEAVPGTPVVVRETLRCLWPATWRLGMGTTVYNVAIHSSGVLFAQRATPELAASFLLGTQTLSLLRQIAQAPFASRIPFLARMWALSRRDDLLLSALRGMRLSYGVFIIGAFLGGLLLTVLLELTHAQTRFPEPLLWILMAAGGFLERFGGMHQNLTAIANRITAHVAGVGFVAIFIVTVLFGSKALGIYTLPTAILLGHILFFSWYSAGASLRVLDLQFLSFERKAFIPAAVIMGLACQAYMFLDPTIRLLLPE